MKKEENIFLHLCFQEEREKMYISLSSFSWREFSQRENFLLREKKTFFFLNSDNFWIVLKLSKTTPLISPINWVSQVSPFGHLNPTLTSFVSLK